MRPHVIIHNMVSLDGRIDGFPLDPGLYYAVAAGWSVDAHLAGSDTIYNPAEEAPTEGAAPDETGETAAAASEDARPLLVVPDSRGRVRNWQLLKTMPYWRGAVALVSRATPSEYVDYLRERNVEYIVVGEERVDLAAALDALNVRYGVEAVHVDSGGTLNGALLRAGLVDEVSVLICPYLVGGLSPRSIYRAADLESQEAAVPLRLLAVEQLGDDVVWLRYEVVRE
jgi:2,5-diamino-6-(ribosylamino)-4(3H)-pyrimidinone 5'-phosphate reductase